MIKNIISGLFGLGAGIAVGKNLKKNEDNDGIGGDYEAEGPSTENNQQTGDEINDSVDHQDKDCSPVENNTLRSEIFEFGISILKIEISIHELLSEMMKLDGMNPEEKEAYDILEHQLSEKRDESAVLISTFYSREDIREFVNNRD